MDSAIEPWKQLLLNAIETNSHLKHSLYFQLATIGSNGRPANRTVDFRGFQEDSDRIQINTDSRTHKVEDLKHCPFVEICWYFADGSNPDPFKLQQREKAWFSTSPRLRSHYLGPYPGVPLLSEQSSLDNTTGPVDAYCLLVLNPDQVDYLNLKSNEKVKFTATQSANTNKFWKSERIVISFSLLS